MEKGLIEIYTGDGKGKTTAAVGLGIRAAGRGLRVVMIQFIKGEETGEVMFIGENFDNFRIHRFKGVKKFIRSMNANELKDLAEESMKGLMLAGDIMKKDICDMLILDEFFGLLKHGLAGPELARNLVMSKPGSMELVLTGRDAPADFMEMADLVSEIKCVKHPFQAGVGARTGIER